jgi:hypothetical protein
VVAGCCACGDEPSGSGSSQLFISEFSGRTTYLQKFGVDIMPTYIFHSYLETINERRTSSSPIKSFFLQHFRFCGHQVLKRPKEHIQTLPQSHKHCIFWPEDKDKMLETKYTMYAVLSNGNA